MRGRDWLTANLNVMVVSRRMNVSWRRFSDFWKWTANVANAMLLMKNCTTQHVRMDVARESEIIIIIIIIINDNVYGAVIVTSSHHDICF